jgi:hypothetical protein
VSDQEPKNNVPNSNRQKLDTPPQKHAQTIHELWPALPAGVTIADDVDLTAPDPCYVPEIVPAGKDKHSHRRCVATNRNNTRCASRAMHQHLICPIHAGAMRYQDGHTARRQRGRERQARAERVLQLQRLGTRAVVAEALVAEAEKVDRAVRHLVDAAARGDIAAAKALIPWLNQALGMPQERVQHTTPSTFEDLERMDTAALQELVAKGRERRLAAEGRLHVVDERLSR